MRRFAIPTLLFIALCFACTSAQAQVGRPQSKPQTKSQPKSQNKAQSRPVSGISQSSASQSTDTQTASDSATGTDSDSEILVTQAGTKLRKVEPKV